MKALDDQVSDRYFEELPNKVLARLEEQQMQSDVNRRSGSANPPLSIAAPKPAPDDDSTQKVQRQEDSGLHDMRALAQTTKQRMSQRRVPTQNPPVDDAALRASHASLRAIALPDPDKMVALDEPVTVGTGTGPAPALLDRKPSATAAPATATARAPITPMKPRSKTPIVVASSMLALAAAGVIGFVVLNKTSTPSARESAAGATPSGQLDRAEQSKMSVTPAVQPAQDTAPAAPAPTAAFSAANGPAPGGEAAAGVLNGVGGASDEAEKADGDKDTKADRADKHGGGKNEDGKKKKDDKESGSGAKQQTDTSGDKGQGDKGTPVSTTDTKKGPADQQDQSLDDLLRGAGVDPNAPKKKEGPKLDKKSLELGDIRSAMGALKGKAQGCYTKFGVSGSVVVKLSVAPSGEVKSAKVTGSFAGTPTGDCVKNVVEGAKFPPWDGNPQTVDYSYFLSD